MAGNDSSTDVVLEALADSHRREIVTYLLETDDATVEELADVLTRRRSNDHEDASDTIAVRLHHVHLPKLDDVDLVDYEPDLGEVEYVGGSQIADLIAATSRQPTFE